MNTRHLPAAKQQISRLVPIVTKTPPVTERQLPDVTRYEAMLDVELGQAAVGAQVIAVLRFAECACIHTRAAPTGRDVIGRAGQRLAPGVADQSCQTFGEGFLQTSLQRVVTRPDAVFHPLDVAKRGKGKGAC